MTFTSSSTSFVLRANLSRQCHAEDNKFVLQTVLETIVPLKRHPIPGVSFHISTACANEEIFAFFFSVTWAACFIIGTNAEGNPYCLLHWLFSTALPLLPKCPHVTFSEPWGRGWASAQHWWEERSWRSCMVVSVWNTVLIPWWVSNMTWGRLIGALWLTLMPNSSDKATFLTRVL